MTWNAVALLFGVLAAAGAAFDKFLLPKTRTALYDKLLAYWIKLDDTPYRDLTKTLVTWVLAVVDRATRGSFFSARSLLLWTAVSWVLTSAVSLLDGVIEPSAYPSESFPIRLPHFAAYFANWIFDLGIFFVTVKVLRIVRDRSYTAGFCAMAINVVAAAALYLGCITTTIWIIEQPITWRLPGSTHYVAVYRENLQRKIQASGHGGEELVVSDYSYEFSVRDAYSVALNCLELVRRGVSIVHPLSNTVKIKDGSAVFNREVVVLWIPVYLWPLVAGTVFIPTLALISALLIFTLAKVVSDLRRYLLFHILEVATASDPQGRPSNFAPGTLVGVVAGLVASVAKALSD